MLIIKVKQGQGSPPFFLLVLSSLRWGIKLRDLLEVKFPKMSVELRGTSHVANYLGKYRKGQENIKLATRFRMGLVRDVNEWAKSITPSRNTVILLSHSCQGDGMSSCIKEDSTAKGRQCRKCGVWMQDDVGFRHLQDLLFCIGAHGEEMLPVPLSSSFHHSCDTNCPWVKPASRISKGWLDCVCTIDACSVGNTLYFSHYDKCP